MTRSIANETNSKTVYAGTETVPGTAVAPDYQWLGEVTITKTQDLKDTEEATGGYDRQTTPALQVPTFSGTYAEDLSFESLAFHPQYAVKEGDTGVSDAETTPGYTYEKSPSFNVDDIASATLVYGIDGHAWRSVGVRHDEFTITIDIDDTDGVWKWSSNLFVGSKEDLPTGLVDGTATGGTATTIVMTGAAWTVDAYAGQYVFLRFGTHAGETRLILSNTIDTLTVDEAFDVTPVAGDAFRIEGNLPAITIPTYEPIPTFGTRVFIDADTGTIGTTEITDRIISLNLTSQSNRTTKRFLNNSADEVSWRSGRGRRNVTGSIRFELDRRDEYFNWQALREFALRVEQTGSEIDSSAGTTKLARIDVPHAAFSTPSEDSRESNMTVTVPFRAYYQDADPVYTITAKNELATLP